MSRDRFLREAVQLAIESVADGGGPFGALVVKDCEIIGRGRNRVTETCDPTAHAEVVAIRDACRRLNHFSLEGCEIYASCEPCPLCLAAIFWARLDRIHYAADRHDAATAGFDDQRLYDEFAKTPENRSIPMAQALRSEAQVALRAWLQKEDRVPY